MLLDKIDAKAVSKGLNMLTNAEHRDGQNEKSTDRMTSMVITHSGAWHVFFTLNWKDNIVWLQKHAKQTLRYALRHNHRAPPPSPLSLPLLHLFIPESINDSTIKWIHHWSIKGPASMSRICQKLSVQLVWLRLHSRDRKCVRVWDVVFVARMLSSNRLQDRVSAVHNSSSF